MSRTASLFLFGLIAIPACAQQVPAQIRPKIEYVKHKNGYYATARSIRRFYKFPVIDTSGRHLVLKNKNVLMKFSVGGQDVWINGIKFVFSFRVIRSNGRYLVSVTDLKKILDPILRPKYIRKNRVIRTVIIDPGHGGNDPGAINRYGLEKDYALRLGHKLKRELQLRGFKHIAMTRSSDRFLTLSQRVAFANHHRNAVFISLHFNSVGRGRTRASGIETFTLSPIGVAHYGRHIRASDFHCMPGNSQDTNNIALATAIHSTLVTRTNRSDRGIRRARFNVLSGIKHPAVLIEGGFMSHPSEARLIHSVRYQDILARGIADALIKYIRALNAM